MLEGLDATHASVAWAVRVASGFGQLTKWEADSVTSPRIAEPWLRLVREGDRKAHEVRPWFVPRVSLLINIRGPPKWLVFGFSSFK